MNGLTQDRVARVGAWRNATRRSPKAGSMSTDACREGSDQAGSRARRSSPDALGRAVEMEVIPRLLVAHWPPPAAEHAAAFPPHPDVKEFATLIATQRASVVWTWVSERLSEHSTAQTLCLQLLMPAARLISERWHADLCHFEEVALGMLNLQHVLHSLSSDAPMATQSTSIGRRILLVSAPSEQNMLGDFMVTEFYRCVTGEFFHRAGWAVWRAPPTSRVQLADLLHTQWFDVIDVASTCAGRLPQLTTDIAEIRRESRNDAVALTVSGTGFVDRPELAVRLGADACACDPRDTLAHAESLANRRARGGGELHRER